MYKVSVIYEAGEGTNFDMDYYVNHHMALVRERLGAYGLKALGVEKILSGRKPEDPAPLHCIGTLLFDSLEDYQRGFEAHGPELAADVPNYTNVKAMFVVSEILM